MTDAQLRTIVSEAAAPFLREVVAPPFAEAAIERAYQAAVCMHTGRAA